MMKSILIKEIKKVGSGMEHNVYQSMNPNQVYKVPKGKNPKIRMSWVYLFQEHPDIFPKIIKLEDKFVKLEKLDTNKAISEYTTLDSILKENSDLWDSDFAHTLFNIYKERDNKRLDEIDEHFEMWGDDVFNLYSKWRDLIIKFLDVMPYDYYSDLHIGQFGYSKDGTLKILDF